MRTHQIGDAGVAFRGHIVDGQVDPLTGQLTFTPVDISSCTVLELIFSVDGVKKTTTATFPVSGEHGYTGPGDGTDGWLQYVTNSAFLDAAGTWSWQAHVVSPAFELKSLPESFEVKRNL